jgi:3-dehydroquinate dehydratase-2
MHIVIINGPNLNLIGKRQPEIYGYDSFDEFIPKLKAKYTEILITYLQSNHEGVLIDWLHQYGFEVDLIILNAGGYTHSSIALADAVRSISSPVIEVHLSNIKERESFRQHSFLEEPCIHTIMGKGMSGYKEAIEYFINFKANDTDLNL